MSIDALGDLNWLAVIVGPVVYFAIGAVWSTPILFGNTWQRAIGWDETRRPPPMTRSPISARPWPTSCCGRHRLAGGRDRLRHPR
ncbi:MAG: DUF1761 domain-containing protein [Chloroflexota bacterium]|nr:DUF1761 domain-containing protein [Chloroflexota bacterium]